MISIQSERQEEQNPFVNFEDFSPDEQAEIHRDMTLSNFRTSVDDLKSMGALNDNHKSILDEILKHLSPSKDDRQAEMKFDKDDREHEMDIER